MDEAVRSGENARPMTDVTSPLTLRADDGTTGEARGVVTPISSASRTIRAVLYVVLGLLGGAACIIIPVLHLITTWGLPLIGVIAAVRISRARADVGEIVGACPACDETIALPGGRIGIEPMHAQCPKCRAALGVSLA